jgi:hypothetical protein
MPSVQIRSFREPDPLGHADERASGDACDDPQRSQPRGVTWVMPHLVRPGISAVTKSADPESATDGVPSPPRRAEMRGASPYSTGGGGTVLEHRYGALLLTHLLTGDPVPELGDDVTPSEISFQASAFSAVDDLVMQGHMTDGAQRTVSIGVRRDPSFVPSDESTVHLVRSYLQVIEEHWPEVSSGQWRLALVVASPNTHVQQLRELANIARDVIDYRQFRAEVARSGRTTQSVRDRLTQFNRVVETAAEKTSLAPAVPCEEFAWRLLGALHLREVRLEGINESDRTIAVGRLRQIISGTAGDADKLFSRLCELVGRYAPAAATKDQSALLRDLSGITLSGSPSEMSVQEGRTSEPAAVDVSKYTAHVRPAVRSDYISQVRRMAPDQLIGREFELAYLSEFCTASDSNAYLWLRAGAWAGKSALLSSFVLDPPVGVRVISFFITARLAGQADRIAFAEVVLEQALELIGEPMPTLLTDATRDAHLLGSLARAAIACQERGERLVLVVDGLDEDQGVISGPDAHSIAALLPADPPGGMRIILAGRLNPPIPGDVPDDHPLRQEAIVHPLSRSPRAEVVRQDAERELKRLLHGSTADQDLLGLVTAAGGGLSGADLAELTRCSSWEIESCLAAVSGRTFISRAGHWRPEAIIYVLGHEELQQHALRFIGAQRLDEYRHRLHTWAELYISRSWPKDTPEYLMRGYFRLLQSTGDSKRMLILAADPARHDRMLDIIGGDTAALTEIAATEEIIVSEDPPDLLAMSRLAVHRARLGERNDSIPANLPGVWAQLSKFGRAEALGRSIPDALRRVQALTVVVREAVKSGDPERADILSVQAESAISSIADPYQHAQALAVVARSAAEAGDSNQARVLLNRADAEAELLGNSAMRAHVLVAIARAVAAVGDVHRATAIANSISEWSERAQAHASIVTEVAKSGDFQQAIKIARAISSRGARSGARIDRRVHIQPW